MTTTHFLIGKMCICIAQKNLYIAQDSKFIAHIDVIEHFEITVDTDSN